MGVKCKEVVVVVINVIFLIFGVAILALGIVFKTAFDDIKDAFKDEEDVDLKGNGEILGLSCIVFGAFIVVLSLCGCIGAWCRNKCLLGIYGLVVLLLLIAEIACVVIVAINGFDVQDKLEKNLKSSLKNFDENLLNDESSGWAGIFELFDCCGVTDPDQDFIDANMNKSDHRQTSQQAVPFPVACCKSFKYKDDTVNALLFQSPPITQCMRTTDRDNHYTTGCKTKITNWLDDNKPVVIAVGVAVFLLQLIIVIVAFYLMRSHDD